MKIYLVVSVARQQMGENVFVSSEKAYSKKQAAESVVSAMSPSSTTVVQGFKCNSENGIIEASLEGKFEKGAKAYVVVAVARQQDGEYVFVNVEKVCKDKTKANEHISGKPTVEAAAIENIQCFVERGILEIILEE